MYSLFCISEDQITIRLPSPAIDLIDWCACARPDADIHLPECCGNALSELFARNPLLLVAALHHYKKSRGRPANDHKQLAEFVQTRLFMMANEPEMLQSDSRTCSIPVAKIVSRLDKYLMRPTPRRLNRLVAAAASLPRAFIARWFASIIGEGFLLPVLSDRRQRRHAELRKIVKSWSRPLKRLPVIPLWRLAQRMQMLGADFEEKLQIAKLSSLRQLAYGASHEINNPLANIASRSQTLLLTEASPTRCQALSVIHLQAMRAHEMISDLMLFARPPGVDIQPTDLRSLIGTIVQELSTDLSHKGFKVEIRQYPNVPICRIDPTQIAVALKAILQNSIDAVGTNGELRIQIWRASPTSVAMAVQDNGPGVAVEIRNHIFDPFFSGREAGRGLGFGLSKAWRIVESHGGSLKLDSSYEQGARFVIELPIDGARNCADCDGLKDSVGLNAQAA
jgi:signal transduction histidine kinase